MPRTFAAAVVALTCAVVVRAQTGSSNPRVDAAFKAFWAADSASAAEKSIAQVLASGADFETLVKRVKAGRAYSPQRTGRIETASMVHGISLDNVIEVPADYDSSRAWPVRVSLHGGVGREPPKAGEQPARPLANRIPGMPEIVIHPRAWAQTEWWTAGQVDNILRLVDKVKRTYNVDESRVYVTGISDGGTGVYFFGMRLATPWSACLPLNGHPSVLANPDTGADGELFSGNLANCPLHIVNGGRDPLYPAASVQPLIEMFKRGGIPLEWQVYPEAGHNVEWWPQERHNYEAFVDSHRRVAHPEKISWETERVDRYNRFRWLIIDRLGKRTSDVSLADVNTFEAGSFFRRALYDRSKPSGRVDIARKGNAFDAKTRGVTDFTLLLSADVIDFSQPVRVTVNAKVVHDAKLEPDAATLMKWAARDNDRTMVYASELKVAVP